MDQKNNFAVPIAIVLAGIVIAGAIYFGDSSGQTSLNKPTAQSAGKTVNIKNVKTDNSPFIGDPAAPVTIAYWFDYQCPACQYNEQTLISPLVEEYVKTGKVKIVFKDFAFLGLPQITDSVTLGVTARAVWEAYPDKFYSWHKMIYENQGHENTGWATKEVINNLTQQVPGIDIAFIEDLVSKNADKYQKQMEDDKAEGSSFGVNATPSFIVSDQLIVGVPQYAQLKSFINTLIK